MCSCHLLHRDQSLFLASYRRTGPRPLSRTGFYSFVEDWDRSSGAAGQEAQIIYEILIQPTDNKYIYEGHLVTRKATFSDPTLSIKERTEFTFRKYFFKSS